MANSTERTGVGSKARRYTVGTYLKLIISGEIPEDSHVELLDGFVVEQMTKYSPHNFTEHRRGWTIREILPAGYLVREEKSLVLGGFWRPEPDLAVIVGPDDLYRSRDPESSDVALVVEVAESSYAQGRGVKWRAYAAARIPTYWIINLIGRQVAVYNNQAGRGKSAKYGKSALLGPGDRVPVQIEDLEVGRLEVKGSLP